MHAALTGDNILMELQKAVKALHLYPVEHPTLKIILEKSYSLIGEFLSQHGNIEWSIDKRGFYEAGRSGADNRQGSPELTKEFFIRHINKLSFFNGITVDEWMSFLLIFKERPEFVISAGGAGKYLSKKSVKGVVLGDTHYDEVHRLAEKVDKDCETSEDGDDIMLIGNEYYGEDEGLLLDSSDTNQTVDEIFDEFTALDDDDISLEELIARLQAEPNHYNYQLLAGKILSKTVPIIEEMDWPRLFPVVDIFFNDTLEEKSKGEEIRSIAQKSLQSLLTDSVIRYLIFRVCKRAEVKRAVIQGILATTGTSGVRLLMDALISREETYARRHIFNTILLFGESARGEAERRIHDGRWYIVRQMVAILREIGCQDSLSVLIKALRHPDGRVKMEVVKSLARFPGKETSDILLEIVKGNDDSLKLQAINTLGILKDTSAIEVLGDIALKRNAYAGKTKLRKEAVRALGMIGDSSAAPILKKLLKKKVWIGRKENEEVRALAAISLGKIGGEDVYTAIEQVARHATGLLYHACEKALKEMR